VGGAATGACAHTGFLLISNEDWQHATAAKVLLDVLQSAKSERLCPENSVLRGMTVSEEFRAPCAAMGIEPVLTGNRTENRGPIPGILCV
jgi:hypothetical protein